MFDAIDARVKIKPSIVRDGADDHPEKTDFDIDRAFPVFVKMIGWVYRDHRKVPFGKALCYDRVAKEVRWCEYEEHLDGYTIKSSMAVKPEEWPTIVRNQEELVTQTQC